MSRLTLVLAACTTLAGCSASSLYVAHHTVVGVNGAMDSNQTSGHLLVGYDRHFAAVVPRGVPDDDQGGKEAMSVLNCSRLEVDGIFLSRFTESLATGRAARNFSRKVKDGGKGSKFFECVKDQ